MNYEKNNFRKKDKNLQLHYVLHIYKYRHRYQYG